jgi:hypothetical protein
MIVPGRLSMLAALLVLAALSSCMPPAPPASPPRPAPVAVKPQPQAALAAPVEAAAPAPVEPAFRLKAVILGYQPDAVLADRLAGQKPAFDAYVSRIETRLATTLAAHPTPKFSAALVIALKPDGDAHAWLVSRSSIPANLATALTMDATTETPFAVQGGRMAFAIVFNAYGGGKSVTDKSHPIPIPPAWHQSATPALDQDGPV